MHCVSKTKCDFAINMLTWLFTSINAVGNTHDG